MLQFEDKTFNSKGLSESHKHEIIKNLFHYMSYENKSLYNSIISTPSANPALYQSYLKY